MVLGLDQTCLHPADLIIDTSLVTSEGAARLILASLPAP
jgi:hypothetical protein